MDDSPLNNLSAELRNRIYNFTIQATHPAELYDGDLNISRTCKQIRQESLMLYYSTTQFHLDMLPHGLPKVIRWLARAESSIKNKWSAIPGIQIKISTSDGGGIKIYPTQVEPLVPLLALLNVEEAKLSWKISRKPRSPFDSGEHLLTRSRAGWTCEDEIEAAIAAGYDMSDLVSVASSDEDEVPIDPSEYEVWFDHETVLVIRRALGTGN